MHFNLYSIWNPTNKFPLVPTIVHNDELLDPIPLVYTEITAVYKHIQLCASNNSHTGLQG